MRPLRTITALTAVAALSLTMAACSSSSSDSSTTPASTPAIASDPAGAVGGSADPATAAAQAACDEILAGTLTQADAEALVKTAGLESRIGTVDGKPNALTMDYNPQRVTFTIDGGTVTDCTVG